MNTVVKTRYGEVRGSVADGVHTFKGIPYAAPPFGAYRLRPPQPVAPWSGVRDALSYGRKPPEPPHPPWVPELAIPGEDCLNLNIWSPDLRSAGRPVMVWISGGLFEYHGAGASPWYDGSRFARDGIVCVTINYRVGPDGFLYLGEGDANRGLLDQIAALQWVQENIAAFGGDPQNVTIFGESAGAMSVGTMLSMPRAEGLFRRAIAQSGAAQHVTSAATAQRISQYLAEKLGVAATREAIAAVPLDRLLAVQEELKADVDAHPDPQRWGEVAANLLPFEPVIDGEILPARPIDRIVAGAGAGVDVMVGTNTEEWRLMLVPSSVIEHVTNEALLQLWQATDCRSRRHWPPIAPHIRAPALAICSQPSRATGIGASPRSAWQKHTPRTARPPICTSLPGAHRSSTDTLARAMGLRLPSSSTRWATRLSRSGEPTLRNSSLTRCMPPGLPLPPGETLVGRSTSCSVGQPCASIRRQRS